MGIINNNLSTKTNTDTKLTQKIISVLMIASSNKKQMKQNLQQKGDPLKGIKYDIQKFQEKFKDFKPHYIETSRDEDMLLSRKFIINWLLKYFSAPVDEIHLFYTGHGHTDGDWQIQTIEKPEGDKITLEEILQLWNSCKVSKKNSLLFLYLDSCYSGKWCYRLNDTEEKNVTVISSCQADKRALSYPSKGGLLFNCLFCLESQFDDNYNILKAFQNPVASIGANKIAPLEKNQLKMLQISIAKACQLQSIQQRKKTIYYPDNDNRLHYEGQVKDGKRQGLGILLYKNGDKYEGQFKDDKANGRGTYYFGQKSQWCGDRYEGQYKNDKASGKGIYYYNDGDRYEGYWKNDKQQGKGIIYYWADGSREIGQWLNGKRQGKVIFQSKDGITEIRQYRNDEWIK